MRAYHVGDIARIEAAFSANGIDVDPATVTFVLSAPASAAVTYVYGTDIQLVKDSTGHYRVDLSIAAAGRYVFRWVATGTGQAAYDGSFVVPGLVDLETAKAHARITATDQDEELQLKLDAAEAAILDYINTTAYWRSVTPTWTQGTVPTFVKYAICLQFAEFYRFLGDDSWGQGPNRTADSDFSPAVVGLLRRTRDPLVT